MATANFQADLTPIDAVTSNRGSTSDAYGRGAEATGSIVASLLQAGKQSRQATAKAEAAAAENEALSAAVLGGLEITTTEESKDFLRRSVYENPDFRMSLVDSENAEAETDVQIQNANNKIEAILAQTDDFRIQQRARLELAKSLIRNPKYAPFAPKILQGLGFVKENYYNDEEEMLKIETTRIMDRGNQYKTMGFLKEGFSPVDVINFEKNRPDQASLVQSVNARYNADKSTVAIDEAGRQAKQNNLVNSGQDQTLTVATLQAFQATYDDLKAKVTQDPSLRAKSVLALEQAYQQAVSNITAVYGNPTLLKPRVDSFRAMIDAYKADLNGEDLGKNIQLIRDQAFMSALKATPGVLVADVAERAGISRYLPNAEWADIMTKTGVISYLKNPAGFSGALSAGEISTTAALATLTDFVGYETVKTDEPNFIAEAVPATLEGLAMKQNLTKSDLDTTISALAKPKFYKNASNSPDYDRTIASARQFLDSHGGTYVSAMSRAIGAGQGLVVEQYGDELRVYQQRGTRKIAMTAYNQQLDNLVSATYQVAAASGHNVTKSDVAAGVLRKIKSNE